MSSVGWIPRHQLKANNYNPNIVPKTELELLKRSIIEDGWTQPIVVRFDGEIIDGFHRWLLSDDPEIRAMTGGLVPVVWLKHTSLGDQIMATIRHNRA